MIVYLLYPLVFSWQYLFMDQVRHCQIWDAATTVSYHIFILHSPSYGVRSTLFTRNHLVQIPLYFSVMIISFFFCASCLILNITTMILLVYRRKHRNSNNIADQKSARIELNMFILTLLIFFNEFALGILSVSYNQTWAQGQFENPKINSTFTHLTSPSCTHDNLCSRNPSTRYAISLSYYDPSPSTTTILLP